jgi:uncharacterized protein
MRKLAQPVEEHGDQITEEVDTITWTGSGAEGKIGPGQFRDFGLSVGVPDRPGKSLTFKSIQTYDTGEVVRWINPPDSEDDPAPQVHLTASEGEHGAAEPAETEPAAATTAADRGDDSGAPTWLAIVALVVGAAGLVAGLAGLSAARRRSA